MNARAVLILNVQTGTQRRHIGSFTAESAPAEFVVPHLADFYAWATTGAHPLSRDTYLRYCVNHPGALPSQPWDGPRHDDDNLLRSSDIVYALTFAEDSIGLRLEIRDQASRRDQPAAIRVHHQGDIYEAAARCCDLLAERTQVYADRHNGLTVPGGTPHTWTQRAATYRARQHDTAHAAAAANLAAVFHPPTFDEARPAVQIAGVLVFAYIHHDGHLRVSLHLDETHPWLRRADDTVAMRITVEDTDVYTA